MGDASIWTLMPVFFSNSGRFARSTSSLYPASMASVIVLPWAIAGRSAPWANSTATTSAKPSHDQRPEPREHRTRSGVLMSTPVLSARVGPGVEPGSGAALSRAWGSGLADARRADGEGPARYSGQSGRRHVLSIILAVSTGEGRQGVRSGSVTGHKSSTGPRGPPVEVDAVCDGLRRVSSVANRCAIWRWEGGMV